MVDGELAGFPVSCVAQDAEEAEEGEEAEEKAKIASESRHANCCQHRLKQIVLVCNVYWVQLLFVE